MAANNRAGKLNRNRGCYFESIDFFLDIDDDNVKKRKNKIPLYKKDIPVEKVEKLYILSDPTGKNIKIEAKRVDEECIKEHTKEILVRNSSINIATDCELILKYDDIDLNTVEKVIVSTGMEVVDSKLALSKSHQEKALLLARSLQEKALSGKNLFDYILLPIFSDANKLREEKLDFISCVKTETDNVKIIIYPDIKYSFEFKEEQTKTHKEAERAKWGKGKLEDEDSDNKLSISIAVEYNKISKQLFLENDNIPIIKFLSNFCKFLNGFNDIEKFIMKGLNLPILQKEYIELSINKPSIQFSLEWQYCTNDKHSEIGRLIKATFGFQPLFGGTITVHLLKIALVAATGGTLAPVIKLATWLQDIVDKLGLKADIFADLIFTGNVNANGVIEINTTESEESSIALQGGLEISGEIKVGALAKAQKFIFKVDAELSVSGKISVTIEGEIKFTKSKMEIVFPITLLPFQLKFLAKGKIALFQLKFGGQKEYKNEFLKQEWKPQLPPFEWDKEGEQLYKRSLNPSSSLNKQ